MKNRSLDSLPYRESMKAAHKIRKFRKPEPRHLHFVRTTHGKVRAAA